MVMLKRKHYKNYFIISFCVLTFFIGITLLSYNYFQSKVLKAYNKMNLELLAYNEKLHEESGETVVSPPVIEKEEKKKEEVKPNTETNKETNKVTKPKIEYIASLKIPKISLKHGLVDIKSKYNDVHYGIQTIKGSNYPNVKNSNLILASHSGTSYVSIFKKLYKLNIGDECIIEYKGKTYNYKIVNIYNKPKIGKITIDRNYNKTTLTLITCTKNSDTLQTIYIAELVK